jgi:hypothetical protein
VPIKGLIVEASVAIPPPGIPPGIPSVALSYHGYRIRGIDRELRHDNPDGTMVEGWHKHLYSVDYGDSFVIATREPKRKDLRGVFKEGLDRWSISVRKQQLEVE